jgi:hypothetical protein
MTSRERTARDIVRLVRSATARAVDAYCRGDEAACDADIAIVCAAFRDAKRGGYLGSIIQQVRRG